MSFPFVSRFAFLAFLLPFAFFISGPGIAGQQNIALLPNGQTVEIDNVHSAGSNVNGNSFGPVNQQFYVNNTNGNTIQYDGFTSVLTAESSVTCGETYHLIIAIADAGDEIFDSGIFLEANSLESNSPIDLFHTISANLFNSNNIVAESCVSTTVTLSRDASNSAVALTIPVDISGTATNGLDYSGIPSSVTFPAGVTQVDFTFNAFQDGLIEGQESIIMSFLILDPCGNVNPLDLTIFINDITDVEIEITGEEITCPGEDESFI